jgi:hypothetical protein
MISRIAAGVLALASFLWSEGSVAAETISPADFHSKVVSIYNFEPRTLGKANFPAKSAQLDEFWAFVKVNAPQALPLLRAELSDPSNSSFFFYDGAKLLLSLSKDKGDQAIALRSLPRADLRSVDHTDYLTTVHWFARNGFDTRQAALRILDFPDFHAFIPQHALTLGQDYSLIYMLFPTRESVFVGDLAERLKGEAALPSQRSLLLALWYTVTPIGTAAIRSFVERPGASGEALTYARELLSRRAGPGVSLSSSSSLREERMKLMQRPISDEALHEFDSLTQELLAKQ